MLTNNIPTALNKCRQIEGVFQLAFDCVNHDIIPDKLTYYGIYNTTVLLLKSFLENRKQKVKIPHTKRSKFFSNWGTNVAFLKVRFGAIIVSPVC